MNNSLPRMFVGSSSEFLNVALALQASLEDAAEVRVWNQDLFQSGNSALEDLLSLVDSFDYAIFIWDSYDRVQSGESEIYSASDNVVLETGMFYGVLGKERVFVLLPSTKKPNIPTDLAGINHLFFREPSDRNYRAALGPASRSIRQRIELLGSRNTFSQQNDSSINLPTIFKNNQEAWSQMKKDVYEAETIAIYGIRGMSAFGTDRSLVSLAEFNLFKRLRKIRIILLSPESSWVNSGLIELRAYESVEVFKKSLATAHEIIEMYMSQFIKRLGTSKSGVRYHMGEPTFGIILTDKVVYIISYAEPPTKQVLDLPVYKFIRTRGSLYAAFRRHFNDLWHNQSEISSHQAQHIDFETSAGGVVIGEKNGEKFIALLRRHDNYWILPKGHRLHSDENLENTALREVEEETGIDRTLLTIDKHADYYTYDEYAEKFDTTKVVHMFLMHCPKGALPIMQPPDHAEGRWWSVKELIVAKPLMLYTYQRTLLYEIIDVISIQSELPKED